MSESPSMRVLRSIAVRTKGWRVGVPADDRVAKALLRRGYVQWAPPAAIYPGKPRRTYALTAMGAAVVRGDYVL